MGTFPYESLNEVPISKWEALSKKKILFGHQSVGNNIISGIDGVIKNDNILIPIKKVQSTSDIGNNGFFHFLIGNNNDPISKINDFSKTINEIDGKVDIAFFKLCFVDINSETDITTIFSNYERVISNLKNDYPDILFIHITVPLLKRVKPSIKSKFLKIFFGKSSFYDDDNNIARINFNSLLLNTYKDIDPIFDLAKLEATFSNGSLNTFKIKGQTYFSLIPEYTDDGGHLNDKGEIWIGKHLLLFFANNF